MNYELAQALARIDGLIRIGTVAEIDNAKRQVRVKSAELLSDWIPWPATISHNFRIWIPPRKKTQVLLVCPSGDFAQAMIAQAFYTDDLNSPSTDENTDMIEFNDGTVIKKDSEKLTIDSPCHIEITAPDATLNTDTTINGNLAVNGSSLTHNGTNCGDTHTHSGIASGPASTGVPN